MDYDYYTKPQKRYLGKILNILEDKWPWIYGIINDFFFGTIKFLKWLIGGLFMR